MKKTKKNVLIVSTAYILYFLLIFLVGSYCKHEWCNLREDSLWGVILFSFAPLLPLFLLSLVTYKMRDNVFRAWWNFARWWAPVIVVVTLLLNNKGSGGGYLGMDAMFDGLIYSILYGVLIITSIVKIVHAYGKK